MHIPRPYERHILILGVVVILAGLIAASDALHAKSEEIIVFAEGLISRVPVLGMLLFVLLTMVSAMLVFFSSAILVPVGVYAWGATVCLILLWIGWFLGGAAAFAVGRYLGRSVATRIVGESTIANFEKQLSGRARFLHIVLFQAALPSEIPGYVLGTLRYRFWPYLAALGIVELPYALGTVYLGASFLEREGIRLILVGVVAILVSVLAYRFNRDRVKSSSARNARSPSK